MILIAYTTRYRGGGAELERAAHTLRDALRAQHPSQRVRCVPTERKAAFVAELQAARRSAEPLNALHFFGHSGMYGPMFGSTAYPEQLSPHEWRQLAPLPFAPSATATFHACRTARWFTSFFAQTFGVPALGYHGYTTFSLHPSRFVWPGLDVGGRRPLYLVGSPGRTSHGLVGSLRKYAGGRLESLKRALPPADNASASPSARYDPVADLYDATFDDIAVRRAEVAWLERHLPWQTPGLRVLDIGCGNGALLQRWAPRLAAVEGSALGVDVSAGMLAAAGRRCAAHSHVSFAQLGGPVLPAEDQSVDVVVSLLSWRYLDWDPILAEIYRVLRPGGRLLVVDMVAKVPQPGEWPAVLADVVRDRRAAQRRPDFRAALQRLIDDPRWQSMLEHHPIRAEHELRWYFESRFVGRRCEVLRRSARSRILAFDSGPMPAQPPPVQAYP